MRLAHRDKFLSPCGMDRDNGIEIGFGGAHFHGDAKALENFVHTKANAMNTNHFLFFTGAD